MRSISLAALCLALVAGCSKKEADKAPDNAGAAGGAPAAAADKPGGGGGGKEVKLPKLGLALDTAGEITLADSIGGEGHMLMGGSVGGLTVDAVKTPQTLDEAKEEAKMMNPANLKDETLPDGWVLSFENTGSMGTNYWVDVRRTIDGKPYKCGGTVTQASQAAAAVAACKTLRKG